MNFISIKSRYDPYLGREFSSVFFCWQRKKRKISLSLNLKKIYLFFAYNFCDILFSLMITMMTKKINRCDDNDDDDDDETTKSKQIKMKKFFFDWKITNINHVNVTFLVDLYITLYNLYHRFMVYFLKTKW